MDNIELVYNYNDVLYKVIGTEQLHNQLQIDFEFFEKYILENSCAQEMQVPEDQSTSDSWTWNKKSILLLLNCLEKNKLSLRHPKIKKKDLWRKIRDEIIKHGYKNIEEYVVERKFRDMKSTYKTIKNNKKKSGKVRGEVKWEYFEAMDKIFGNDRTFNITHTISSMQAESPTTSSSASSLVGTQKESCHCLPTTQTATSVPIDTEVAASTQVPSCNSSRPNITNPTLEINFPSVSLENTQATESVTLLRKRKKTERNKQLHDLRTKLDIVKEGFKELVLLRELIEKNNAIQSKRNDLLKQILDKIE